MKKILLFALALISITATAQPPMGPMPPKPEDGFKFTVVKENPITSVKNQASTGTCWCSEEEAACAWIPEESCPLWGRRRGSGYWEQTYLHPALA